jgi:hypothetical protein
MFDKNFTTEAEALAEITAGKGHACATALTNRFQDAVDSGILDLNLAAEKAVLLHAHLDHGQGLDVPEDFPFTLDAEAESHIVGEIMSVNHDGRAEERADLTIDLYRKYRGWGVNIFFAGTAAFNQAQIEWEKTNPTPDIEEDYFFKLLEPIGDPDLLALIKGVYADERKDGKNVRDSAISAIQAARIAASLATLFGGGSGPDVGSLLGGLSL